MHFFNATTRLVRAVARASVHAWIKVAGCIFIFSCDIIDRCKVDGMHEPVKQCASAVQKFRERLRSAQFCP